MNAQSKAKPAEPDNLALWKSLGKTDPAHTKGFKRAGGFTGTAIKPIWIIQRLTEQFGPVGVGWGMGHPRFEVHPGHNHEVLVFCTVECWHTSPDNSFVGVGGDKLVTHIKANTQYNRPERWENDDEAFKKAFTDAVGNAFKFVGVGADVHMGLFDDSKYVRDTAREFAAQDAANDAAGGHSQQAVKGAVGPRQQSNNGDGTGHREKLAGPYTSITQLKTAVREFVRTLQGCGDGDELRAFLDTKEARELIEQVKRDMVGWWEGWPDQPPEFVPLHRQIEMKEYEMAQQIADIARA